VIDVGRNRGVTTEWNPWRSHVLVACALACDKAVHSAPLEEVDNNFNPARPVAPKQEKRRLGRFAHTCTYGSIGPISQRGIVFQSSGRDGSSHQIMKA
jgi:hypothetical protein